jgi:two-component system phosphate regulon sensor histidine kinase PhoR
MTKKFFPWRIYWSLFFNLIFVVNALILISLATVFLLGNFLLPSEQLLSFLSVYFFLSLVTAALVAYRFVTPLKRVILKALRLANKKKVSETESLEDVFEEEPGEYQELEAALNKIRRKLKKRRSQLTLERQESQALMSALDDAILTVDPHLNVRFYNSRFANQFVDKSLAEKLTTGESAPLEQIFREPELLVTFRKTIESAQVQTKILKLASLVEGDNKYFTVKVTPLIREKTGELYGAMSIFHDVTEIKMAEQIRTEFVENASHELRTPLTSIKGFVATARDDLQQGKTDQLSYFFKVISRNVDRLSDLVSDMLNLSSLESGGILHKELLDLDELTQELVEGMARNAGEKQILIQVTNQADKLVADSRKVEQVLTNLVGNAIKYIPLGGKIDILWVEDQDCVRLHVRDNGPGIADVHLQRLFERFYRIDKGRSRDVGGTGLGLSIVKHIMQSHGGGVQVKSELGRGSEFICSFPK